MFLITAGGDPLHDLPLDHGDHRDGRADLALPGRLRRHRWVHGLPARRSLRPVGARRRAARRRASPPSSPRSLSLPVRRLGGIWVAIATLAFAYFFDSVMVKFSWVGGGETSLLQGTRVPRPVLGPWDFADDRAFLVLVAHRPRRSPSLAVIQIRAGHGRARRSRPCGGASWPPSRSASRSAEPGWSPSPSPGSSPGSAAPC